MKQKHTKKHTDKYKQIYAQCNGPSETKRNPENCKNCSSKCAYDCAQLQCTIQHFAWSKLSISGAGSGYDDSDKTRSGIASLMVALYSSSTRSCLTPTPYIGPCGPDPRCKTTSSWWDTGSSVIRRRPSSHVALTRSKNDPATFISTRSHCHKTGSRNMAVVVITNSSQTSWYGIRMW